MQNILRSMMAVFLLLCVVRQASAEVVLSQRYLADSTIPNLRTEYFRGEYIVFQIDASPADGTIGIDATVDGETSRVWEDAHNRTQHIVRLPTADLRAGDYEFRAVVSNNEVSSESSPLKLGIRRPLDDAFPIYTFNIAKHNMPRTDEAFASLIERFRAGGYNQIYIFLRSDSLSSGGIENPRLIWFMNDCVRIGLGIVPMVNTFLYGDLDDETAVVTASGNFATTYVYHSSLKRMVSVRHPRHIEGVKEYFRRSLTFLQRWPVVRAIVLDDEPTSSFYNVFGAGRVDKAPEGEAFWGLGDYNKTNVAGFRQRYQQDPPRFGRAAEVHAKYPAGSVLPRDAWIDWMAYTGSTFGDYYAAITPTIREIAPNLKILSEPFLGLCGAFWGLELQSFHRNLDAVNFHYIGTGQPAENAASTVILGQSVRGDKPVLAMVHSAIFDGRRPDATPKEMVYSPAYVMQQFWSCIGTGAKGIGEQGEFDISQRADTWEHWTQAAHDVADISPLLLKAHRPKSPVALLYSVESEWMQAAYREHPLEIWRQHHTFELIQAALQRANIPFDVISTLDLAQDPTLIDGYQAVICAAIDYALEDVDSALKNAQANFYVTPDSAYQVPNAQVLTENFDELYRLYKDVPIRDARTYHQLINDRADYLKHLLNELPLTTQVSSQDTLTFLLDVPGAKLVTIVNCGLDWQFAGDPDETAMAKIRTILGNGFEMPKGAVTAAEADAKVTVTEGRYAYDLRTHQQIASATANGLRLYRCLAGGEGALILITPTQIESLRLAIRQDDELAVSLTVDAIADNEKPLTWAVPVRIEITSPDGRISEYTTRALIDAGQATVTFRMAQNDQQGNWNVTVTELASGKQAAANFTFNGVAQRETR